MAQTTTLMPEGRQRYFNNDGSPCAGGRLYTYAAGTTALKATYSDPDGLVPNPNPVPLDAHGEAVVYWTGAYKVDLKQADGQQVTGYPVDNLRTDPGGVWGLLAQLKAGSGADNLGFNQGVAGAVDLLLGAVLRESVSVQRFGTKGDGVVDDSDAIQAALNYAATTSDGRNIRLPRGIYRVTKPLNVMCDKVGLIGDGAKINFECVNQLDVLFNVSHSPTTIFPAFRTVEIKGIRIQSSNPKHGVCFSVVGNGVDRFAAQIHYDLLDIKDFHIAFNYGDYAFSPVVTRCSVAGCNQAFKEAGATATGAHFVFQNCLFTALGDKANHIIPFDLGGVNTYKFIACDLEASAYTLMTTTGSDVYLYGCHMELDVGATGAPLFQVMNADYGHFAFEHCTGFWWQSTADTPPLYAIAARMSAFSITSCRIITNQKDSTGANLALASVAMLTANYHPFLCNFGVTLRSPMQPRSGQGFLLTGPANNALSNWDFSAAFTTDFTAGGAGAATVQVVADRPYGLANAMEIGRSATAQTGLISIPDGAQVMMAALWGNTTFYNNGLMNLEMHLYNANQVEIGVYTQNITGAAVNVWQRFDINLYKTIADKKAKYVRLVFNANAGTIYRVAYPFIDFA